MMNRVDYKVYNLPERAFSKIRAYALNPVIKTMLALEEGWTICNIYPKNFPLGSPFIFCRCFVHVFTHIL